MVRYKSLFDVLKDIETTEHNDMDKPSADAESAGQSPHLDFIHPDEIRLETDEGYESEQHPITGHPHDPLHPLDEGSDFDDHEPEWEYVTDIPDQPDWSSDFQDFSDEISSDKDFGGYFSVDELDDLNAKENSFHVLEYDDSFLDDVEEISPFTEADSDDLLPKDSKTEDWARDLAFHYGRSEKSARKAFLSILEEFQHHQSYLAIRRLIDKGFSLDVIIDASNLRSDWQSSPDLWLKRVFGMEKIRLDSPVKGRDNGHDLTWEICANLCLVYGYDEAFDKIANHWKAEWINLDYPPIDADKQTKNNYWYFASFIAQQTDVTVTGLPVRWVDYFDDDEQDMTFSHKQEIHLKYNDWLLGIEGFIFCPYKEF